MEAGDFAGWEEELAALPTPDAFGKLDAESFDETLEELPEGLSEASLAEGELYHGKVKTYNAMKGFGFVTSDQIDGDIMFGNQEVPALLKGQNLNNMLVKFDVKAAAKGTRAAAMSFGVSQLDLTEFSSQFWGTVKRYNPAKGFGFVVAPEAGEGDIFFGAKDLHPMLKHLALVEMEMGFDLVENEKGRRAANIAVMVSSATAGQAGVAPGGAPVTNRGPAMAGMSSGTAPGPWKMAMAMAGMSPMPQGNAQGSGKIKSFSAMKGWGFILMHGSEADVYFQAQNLQDLSPAECVAGLDVNCEIELVKGRPQARHIRRAGGQKRMLGSAFQAFPAFQAFQPMQKRPRLGLPLQQQGTGGMSYGTIKSFNGEKGFGFVLCEATGGDAYFKTEHLVGVPPHAITPGTPVMYELVEVNGKPQCRKVQLTGSGPFGAFGAFGPFGPILPMMAKGAKGASPFPGKGAPRPTGRTAPVQASTEPAAGTVKSWHAGTYGFMTCPEVEGDVWFGVKSLSPGVAEPSIGDTLVFQMVKQPNGRCKAQDGSVEPLL